MDSSSAPKGFRALLEYPLVRALLGRRSRRFGMGMEIPDGHFAYRSRHPAMPLSELETMLVVTACGGNTSWHHMIYRGEPYVPHLSNYAAAAGGRTFPSAAGFETSQLFYTDDTGVYLLDTRDAPAWADPDGEGGLDLAAMLDVHGNRVRKLGDTRLGIPCAMPYVEAHNTWVVNRPGTLLVIPVGDLAQHVLLGLCYYLQNGSVFYDNTHGRAIPGLDAFRDLADVDHPLPLTFLEQWSFGEVTAELSCSCYAGALLLQAMGLGGWMFNGLDPFAVLGASGDPGVPGLGFRYDTDARWPLPNPTGLPGVMEGFCPPHYTDMRAAVDALCARKFGPGGPFHPDTPGPWKDSAAVRRKAMAHDARFRACVALQAQYVFDTFGKFPGTVPSMLCLPYLQAFHLDTEFYDRFYKPGAYLATHARHRDHWHQNEESGYCDVPEKIR